MVGKAALEGGEKKDGKEKKESPKGEHDDVGVFFQQNAESSLACPKTLTVKAFLLQLHLYHAKVHLQTDSYRSSKRDIKLALNADANSAEATVLKANLEYLKGNNRKSLKLLQTAYTAVQEEKDSEKKEGSSQGLAGSKVPDIEPLVQNNIACIHYSMQNYHAALW